MTLPITAIVPVRNAASHLRQALDSCPSSASGMTSPIAARACSFAASVSWSEASPPDSQ